MKLFLFALGLAFLPIEVHSQNNALNFDGKESLVSVPSTSSLNVGSQLTIEAWVNLQNPNAGQKIVGKSPIQSGYLLGVFTGQIDPEIWNGPDMRQVTDNRAVGGCIPANQWTHLAVTFVAGLNMIAYVNGIEVRRIQVSNNPILADSVDLIMGMEPFLEPRQFKTTGSIDEVALWNVARTQAEIQTDMLGSISPVASLIAYYNFNQGIANGNNRGVTTLQDVSGNGHYGTLKSFALLGAVSNFVPGFVPPVVLPSPTITSISPGSGEEGTVVTITGTNFSATPANNIVTFRPSQTSVVISSTATSIVTSVPGGCFTGRITLQVDCNRLTDSNFEFVITVVPPLWQTWWAYTAYSLGFIGLLFVGRRVVINRERKKFEMEMERKRIEALRESEQLKTKFFSNVTHEFRTPLTLIQGPAKELYDKETDPEAKQLLSLIRNNSDRLLRLVNQLLDLAKLDAREMKLNLAPVDLASSVRGTVTQFASQAHSKGIKLEWIIAEPMPYLMADNEKIEAILFNLISNAMKFTAADGTVAVEARWTKEYFMLRVTDTGRGIPAEKLQHIFDRFYQVNPTDSSHSEGTGIGLALVKEYTEIMKGTLEVESKVGSGTLFSIKLPLVQVSGNVEPGLAPEGEKKKEIPLIPVQSVTAESGLPVLLLVEDHADIRFFIKTCLGSQYHYKEAQDGKEGLAMAREAIPDLIISDLMMPEMDGLQLCHELKKDRRTDHIPFIVITAKAAEERDIDRRPEDF